MEGCTTSGARKDMLHFTTVEPPFAVTARLLRSGCGIRGSVAGCAILWCRFVEEHRLGGDHFRQFVTFSAADVLMRAAQRKFGSLVVVKK